MHINAIGGNSNIKSKKSISYVITGPNVEVNYFIKHKESVNELVNFNGELIYTVYNDGSMKRCSAGKETILSKDELGRYIEDSYLFKLHKPAKRGWDLKLESIRNNDELIEIHGENRFTGQIMHYFLNPVSYYLEKIKIPSFGELYYGNYQKIDGVYYPMTQRFLVENSFVNYEISDIRFNINEISFNEKLDGVCP